MMNKKTVFFAWLLLLLFASNLYSANVMENMKQTEGLTRGEYLGQKWHIDNSHMLWWNQKPYIPFGINEVRLNRSSDEVTRQIRHLHSLGITDIYQVGLNTDIPRHRRAQAIETLKTALNTMESLGMTYVFYYTSAGVIEAMRGNRSVDFLLQKPVMKKVREELASLAAFCARPGMRAVVFMEEINGNEGIEDSSENLRKYLPAIFESYGFIIKETMGDIPVIINIAADLKYRPFLESVSGKGVDGILVQIHGASPKEVGFKADFHLPKISRVLKSFPSTKLLWAYSQPMIMEDFVLYRSQNTMKSHFSALARNQVTGILMDQVSSFGFVRSGLGKDPESLRGENLRWFARNKPEIVSMIQKPGISGKNQASGKVSNPAKRQTPTDKSRENSGNRPSLTPEKVKRIIMSSDLGEKIRKLEQKGAVAHKPIHDQEQDYWIAGWGNRHDYFWKVIVDDPSGEILFQDIDLLNEITDLGYPAPKALKPAQDG